MSDTQPEPVPTALRAPLQAVENDLFPKDSDGIAVPDAGLNASFELRGPIKINPELRDQPIDQMLGPDLSAVPWALDAEQVGEFRGIPSQPGPISIVGVSLLATPGDTDPAEGRILHRFVNWEEVMAQLGVFYATRPLSRQGPGPDGEEPVWT